jgi:hypothetical protein
LAFSSIVFGILTISAASDLTASQKTKDAEQDITELTVAAARGNLADVKSHLQKGFQRYKWFNTAACCRKPRATGCS